MAPHRYSSRADADLLDIWEFIAADNPQAADRLLLKVDEQCQLLANSNQQPPGRLTPRDRSGSPILVKGATLSSTGWFWMALRWCASFTVLGI
jgi:plasmid stabilization system protein ParE